MQTKARTIDAPISNGSKPLLRGLLILLWLLSLVTAMSVVYTTFDSRKSVQRLEELRQEAIGLRVSSGQYKLEKSSLASYSRVESLAVEKLNMSVPESTKTVLVLRK